MASVSLISLDEGGGRSISDLHEDIIQTHILTRLDGATLASAGCASAELRDLCDEDKLWREICRSMWPSVEEPRVRDAVSSFPGGHRQLFSESFPLVDRCSGGKSLDRPMDSTEWIAAVDMHYGGTLVFSKVQQFGIQSDWFLTAPFRVELIDPKDSVPTPIHRAGENESWRKDLEENLTLSWILIDPTRKRSVNLSSRRSVSVQRHWLTGDLEVRYAVVMAAAEGTSDPVQCSIVATCGGKEGGALQVTEVSLAVEDMEGRHLNGKECLVILSDAMENGTRRKWVRNDCKERFEAFAELKRQKNQRKQRRERAVDMLLIATGLAGSLSFFGFLWFL